MSAKFSAKRSSAILPAATCAAKRPRPALAAIPGLSLIHISLLEEGIANINKQFGAKFTINATGATEEEAYAQCDAQAKQKYEEQSASIKAALVALQTSFNTKKAELLPSFTEDEKNKYYINDVAYGMVSYQKSIAIAPGYEDIYIVEDLSLIHI